MQCRQRDYMGRTCPTPNHLYRHNKPQYPFWGQLLFWQLWNTWRSVTFQLAQNHLGGQGLNSPCHSVCCLGLDYSPHNKQSTSKRMKKIDRKSNANMYVCVYVCWLLEKRRKCYIKIYCFHDFFLNLDHNVKKQNVGFWPGQESLAVCFLNWSFCQPFSGFQPFLQLSLYLKFKHINWISKQ